MTKEEALRLALDTLKEVRDETFRLMRNGERLHAEDKVWSTIISVQEALETKDEPVAWMVWGHDNVPSLTFTKPADKYVFDSLYMIPSQRTWVGLTREELAEILCDDRWQGRPELMMLQVQAKLKDKNNG